MNKKMLVFGSAIVLLAAGCSSQPQANSQSSPPSSTVAQNQTAPTSPAVPMSPSGGSASSTRRGFGMPNLPAGSKPFFGTIASVSGSQITISGHMRNSSSTASTIINITSSTTYQGGSQSSLTTGTRVAGIGTTNGDGSLNATSIQINPTFSGRGSGGGYGGPHPTPTGAQ